MEIVNFIFDNFTIVELIFLGLIFEVIVILFLVEAGLHAARFLRLISKEKYQVSLAALLCSHTFYMD